MRILSPLSLAFICFAASGSPGCDKTPTIGPLRDGLPECIDIGEACHEPGEKLHGRYEECHEIGHINDGKECIAAFDECMALCKGAVLGEGGAGGEGGAHAAGGEGGTPAAGGAP